MCSKPTGRLCGQRGGREFRDSLGPRAPRTGRGQGAKSRGGTCHAGFLDDMAPELGLEERKGLHSKRRWGRENREGKARAKAEGGKRGMGAGKEQGRLRMWGKVWGPLGPCPPSDPSKAPVSSSRTSARLHHQLLGPPEALLAPTTYQPLTYQGLYPGASSPLRIPRARPTPYPLPNIQADRDQESLPLPARLGLLPPTAMCLGPVQDPQ